MQPMIDETVPMSEEQGLQEALSIFQSLIGASNVDHVLTQAGGQPFLKFVIGRSSAFYQKVLVATQRSLSAGNPFRGAIGLVEKHQDRFPESLEAISLLTLLTRSTRAVSEDSAERGFAVQYVPFQNREDHQLAQPATHVVVGRRGVGKSTLIRRATEILQSTKAIYAVIDMQAYGALAGDDLARELLHDIAVALARSAERVSLSSTATLDTNSLFDVAKEILAENVMVAAAVPRLKRALGEITKRTRDNAFVFLDDFHLLARDEQPKVLNLVHGFLKGASGWLKVAGVRSLLNTYSSASRIGLQVPGDAQSISLDLTLENPEAAETHLRAILQSFLTAIGYEGMSQVIPKAAFKRLVWANAGVPRDFLQMFGRAIEHARKNRHAIVTLSDVNSAIGEFGQRKMDEMRQDASNSEGELHAMLDALEIHCLDNVKVNAFLLRSEESEERRLVHMLSDLRLVHLINQSITPDRAGEKYEAYIIDYSRFTGFRRRPNVKEMIPDEGQFKASELRKLPKVSDGFLARPH